MPRFLIGVYALLALGAIGYTGYWFHLASRAESKVNATVADWQEDGWVTAFDEKRTFGYPYRLSTEFKAPVLARPQAFLPWQWQGELVRIHVQPWDLHHYIAVLEGPHRITLSPQASQQLVLDADAESARTSLTLNSRYQLGQLSADIHNLKIGLEGTIANVLVAALQAHIRTPETPGALDTVMIADTILLPEGSGGALGREIRLLSADTTLAGPVPERLDGASAAQWRDAGGTIEAHRLVLYWGALEIEAAGTLTLDGALRPLVTLQSDIRGLDALIESFEAIGAMDGDVATAAKIALTLFAETTADDPRPLIKVPLTIRDGLLSAGPIPLVNVPPVFEVPGT